MCHQKLDNSWHHRSRIEARENPRVLASGSHLSCSIFSLFPSYRNPLVMFIVISIVSRGVGQRSCEQERELRQPRTLRSKAGSLRTFLSFPLALHLSRA